MSEQQSSGSKLGAIAGVVISIAFFLPWVNACNTELSGYDIATNQTGLVEDAWMYWITLLAGLFCLVIFFLLKTNTGSLRRKAAVTRLIIGSVGFLPLVNIWLNVRQRGGVMEILYGGWIIVVGFTGIFVSFLMDLGGTTNNTDY